MALVVVGAALLSAATNLAAQHAPTPAGRPLRIEDLFSIESLQAAVLSPDGEWLAVVIQRPSTSREVYNRSFLLGNEHADVWLVSTDGRTRRNLTHGLRDASGYWSPVWSPDGRRLAMLSTAGGDNVRVYVWQQQTNEVRPLSPRPVDLLAPVHEGSGNADDDAPPFAWLSPTELLFVALPDTLRSDLFDAELRTQRIAPRAWAETERGEVAQVSVLDSPVGFGDTGIERAGLLVRVDLARAGSSADPEEHVIGRVSLEGFRRMVVLSPRRNFAAVTEALFAHPRPGEPFHLDQELNKARLGVMALDGSSTWWVDSAPPDPTQLAWSADGRTLAIVGSPGDAAKSEQRGFDPTADSTRALFLVSPAPRTSLRVTGPDLAVLGTEWAGTDRPLVYATSAEDSSAAPAWWVVSPNGSPRLLTEGIDEPGPRLARVGGACAEGEWLLLSGAGDLWLLDATVGGAPTNMTRSFEPRITSIVWPQPSARDCQTREVLLETERESGPTGSLYRLELSSRDGSGAAFEPALLERPASDARLVAFHPSRGLAVFGTFVVRSGSASPTASDGPELWVANSDGANVRTLVRLNPQLETIIEPETRFIHYRGLDGDSLIASVTLPVGYQEGVRYPAVFFVYAGSVVRDTVRPHDLLRKNVLSPLNLQLLAAHGYVVVMPSMPLPGTPSRGDAYLELMKGVLPAVDKLIDLGIADPDRLGVMGQSFGGFSTYGLITQTNRFRAGIALAGPVDWISSYGIFDMRSRYLPVAQLFALPGVIEGLQPGLGASPWENLWAYLRNSPLYYLDRVSTPLLIIQGDIDYVPIAQGEMAFTAMLRLGKRARFVRYWGEGHVLDSPANIRDMWERILAWLDEHLVSLAGESRTDGAGMTQHPPDDMR